MAILARFLLLGCLMSYYMTSYHQIRTFYSGYVTTVQLYARDPMAGMSRP